MIERTLSFLPIAFMLFWAGTASAQSTFGEFVDMGAKKVLKDEWISILPIRAKGTTNGGDFDLELKADGTISGSFASSQGGGVSSVSGTWTMDENGKRCTTEYFASWNKTWTECNYVYRLGEKYYGTRTDSDRNAKVGMRAYILNK